MSDITSLSINDIATEIANKYYLLDYPSICKDGVLEYAVAANSAKRENFGILPAAQVAALIPYIAIIYIESNVSADIQKQIDLHLSGANIKLMQVVALMKASGRWKKPNTNPATDLDIVYLDQSISECKRKLIALGMDAGISENFATLLDSKQQPSTEPYSFLYLIVQDAITIVDGNTAEEILPRLKFANAISDEAGKNKFVSLVQAVSLAKSRQKSAIAENANALFPITVSFQRMLGALSPNFAATMAAIAEKPNNLVIQTSPSVQTENTLELDVSVGAILVKHNGLEEITAAINAFTDNVDNIQSKLGPKKTKYAENLYLAFEQTWNAISAKANDAFEQFQTEMQSNCKTDAECLAAIEKRIQEIEYASARQ